MPSRSRPAAPSGLTLIELIVVMVILGILASLVGYSLGGVTDRQQLALAVETIERFDAHARRDARRQRRSAEATIDRIDGRLTIRTAGPTAQRRSATFRLPKRVEIKEIRLRRRQVIGGSVDIDVNRYGHSPTYALHLQRGKLSRWLVVLGISGQVISFDTPGEADAILSL